MNTHSNASDISGSIWAGETPQDNYCHHSMTHHSPLTKTAIHSRHLIIVDTAVSWRTFVRKLMQSLLQLSQLLTVAQRIYIHECVEGQLYFGVIYLSPVFQ